MIPSRAYRQQQSSSWTRIDLLLTCYDGAIDRLGRALAALRRGDEGSARTLLLKFQGFVLALASGVNPDSRDPSSVNLLRLYEFCGHCAASGRVADLEGAQECLTTLREAFRAVRPEAVRLEQTGALPAVDAPRFVQTSG